MDEVIEMYRDGVRVEVIALRLDLRPQAVYDSLDEARVERRVGARREAIRGLFDLGFSTRRIAEYYGGLDRRFINEALR